MLTRLIAFRRSWRCHRTIWPLFWGIQFVVQLNFSLEGWPRRVARKSDEAINPLMSIVFLKGQWHRLPWLSRTRKGSEARG